MDENNEVVVAADVPYTVYESALARMERIIMSMSKEQAEELLRMWEESENEQLKAQKSE